ncbi:MAG: zinc-binding dehydrogenase [Melioribacteraceae bacterium]|nr:zinc-binding dehydrogenase [Melioribacteraceae bacterium]
MLKSKTIIFTAPLKVEIGEFELPELEAGQILTKTLLSGVSTGTETRVLSGKQEGAEFPLIPGYENLGEIVKVGEGVNLNIGARVFTGTSELTGHYNKSWGAHLEYAIVNENSVIPVPESVTDEEAIFTKIGAISLHGVKRAKVSENEKVVVIGLGLIGCLAGFCCKAFGAEVIAVDPSDERLEIAKKGGADYILNPTKVNLSAEIIKLTNGGADVVIDATGIAKLADSSARLLKGKDWDNLYHPSGRFLLLGSCVDPIIFNYNDTLFMNEIDIMASRDTVKEDLVDMLNLIRDKKVDVKAIKQNIFNYEEAPNAYNKLLDEKLMRIVFDWRNK